jgi:hypothetical protein
MTLKLANTGPDPIDRVVNWDDNAWTTIEPAGIKFRILAVKGGDPKGEPAVALIDYPPNFKFPAHRHDVPHIEIVVSGEQYVGGRLETAGATRWVPAHYEYGPLEMGPEGARIVEVFPDGDLPTIFGEILHPEELAPAMGIELDELLAQLAAIIQ